MLYPNENESREVRRYLSESGLKGVAKTIPVYAYRDRVPGPWDTASDRTDLLFVGGFNHPPNADGLAWFVTSVLPLLRAQFPELKLFMVGSNAGPVIERLQQQDGVWHSGQLDDELLAQQYAKRRVAIAPLKICAGMKGKVVEAMHFGVPCVTTTVGTQGFEFAEFLASSDDESQQAALIARLLADNDHWREVSRASHAFAEAHFSRSTLETEIKEGIEVKSRGRD